jgi:uncharacterized protein YpmS
MVATLSLLAALTTLVTAWLVRRWRKADDPSTIKRKKQDDINQVIVTGNQSGLNRLIDGLLDKSNRR